jgi:hypothetical protein
VHQVGDKNEFKKFLKTILDIFCERINLLSKMSFSQNTKIIFNNVKLLHYGIYRVGVEHFS